MTGSNSLTFPQRPKPPTTLAQAQQLLEVAWTLIENLQATVEEQQHQIDELLERVGKSSRNSSRSPSSDSPAQKVKRPKKPASGRQQGAQPGHKGHQRATLPESEVDHIERYFPSSHCCCGMALAVEPHPNYRHQVFDLPKVQYTVTEHQIYRGYCGHCHIWHTGKWPEWVPQGQMVTVHTLYSDLRPLVWKYQITTDPALAHIFRASLTQYGRSG